jgi:hypothetical protein
LHQQPTGGGFKRSLGMDSPSITIPKAFGFEAANCLNSGVLPESVIQVFPAWAVVPCVVSAVLHEVPAPASALCLEIHAGSRQSAY